MTGKRQCEQSSVTAALIQLNFADELDYGIVATLSSDQSTAAAESETP